MQNFVAWASKFFDTSSPVFMSRIKLIDQWIFQQFGTEYADLLLTIYAQLNRIWWLYRSTLVEVI